MKILWLGIILGQTFLLGGNFSTCTFQPHGCSGKGTSRLWNIWHVDISAEGHYDSGTFWHGDISSHFNIGTIWHRDLLAETTMVGAVTCLGFEMSMVLVPKPGEKMSVPNYLLPKCLVSN